MESPPDASVVLRVASPSAHHKAATTEDQDLMLARAIQEQENAFMLLASGQYGGSEYGGDYGMDEGAGAPAGVADELQDEEGWLRRAGGSEGDSAAGGGTQEEGLVVATDGEGEVEEEVVEDDEALARRLQEEEQYDLYQRMLEMSGFNQRVEGEVEELDVDALSYEELQALGEAAGTVSRGLSADAICRLSEASFRQLKQKQQWQQQQNDAPGQGTGAARSMVAGLQTCTICLVDFEDEDTLKVLPCTHAYHSSCLSTWLGVSKACPVCNAEVQAAGAQGVQQ